MDRHLSLRFLAILLSLLPLLPRAQTATAKPMFANDIFIPLRGREEVKIIPLLDTLSADREYLFKIQFSPKYRFSELFFDKGLATRSDSFLSIRPKTSRTEGADTATLRVIGFSNNSRILLIHRFTLLAQARVFPNINPNVLSNICVNNMALERNMEYSRSDFPDKCIFNYMDNGRFNKDNVITAITLSLVNRHISKNLYIKGDKPTDDMIHEIHKVAKGSLAFIRLDIKNGKKTKSVWTRFVLSE